MSSPWQNLCRSYLLELHQGIHVWGTDQMKLALYTSAAQLDPNVITAYSAVHESAGTNYPAGGFNLTLAAGFPKLVDARPLVLIDFEDIAVTPAFFATTFGLIYNSSKANRAVAVLNWGLGYFATVDFGIKWPPPDASHCVIRLGAGE
jgi:hypothetical protein